MINTVSLFTCYMTKLHEQYEVSIIPPILYTEKLKFKENKKSDPATYSKTKRHTEVFVTPKRVLFPATTLPATLDLYYTNTIEQ